MVTNGIRRINSLDKNKEYIKILKNCVIFICFGFVLKIIFYLIGCECINTDKKFFIDTGNEAFINLGNEIFTVICILSIIFAFVKIIVLAKDGFFSSIMIDGADTIEVNRKQSNCFFVISIAACIVGFILILISVILISIEGGEVINFLLVLAGIISEITAVGFLVVYNKSIDQINVLHKLMIRKEQYHFLINEVDKLQDNKEELIMKLVENMLKDNGEELKNKKPVKEDHNKSDT